VPLQSFLSIVTVCVLKIDVPHDACIYRS
jgi:hypothetical protein